MFLIAALTIITGFILYSWWHLHTGLLRQHLLLSLLSGLLLFALTFLPFLLRNIKNSWFQHPNILMAGWIWFAWLFWFSCLMAVLDCWNGTAIFACRLRRIDKSACQFKTPVMINARFRNDIYMLHKPFLPYIPLFFMIPQALILSPTSVSTRLPAPMTVPAPIVRP